MRHRCTECNQKVKIGEGRTNLRCNVCGCNIVTINKDVSLKCDLCMPCKLPNLQKRIVNADEVFDSSNKCLFSSAHGQNTTWNISLVARPEVESLPIEKKIPPKKTIPRLKPKRKYVRRKPLKTKIL